MSESSDVALEVLIKSVLDATGYRMNEAEAGKLKASLGNLSEVTKEGAKSAEKSEISHRALHQILHLIGHEAGPAAGAALSGLAAAATSGVMVAILAVKQLFEWLHQGAEEAKKLKEALEAKIDISGLVKDVGEVEEALEKSNKQIDDFFKTLDRKAAGDNGFKKLADAQIEHLQRVAEAEKKLADAEAEREKARLEFLKSTHQISEADYKAGVEAANNLKSKKESSATSELEAKSLDALHQALTNILAQQTGARRELNDAKGQPSSETRLGTLKGLFEANQKKLDDLEKLQKETPSYAAAFLNSFQHPTESVEQFRQRIAEEIGAQMNELRAQEASLRAQMLQIKNSPDKIKELEDKLNALEADRASIQEELGKRNDAGTVNSDEGRAELVQKFLEAQQRRGGGTGDTEIIAAMNQLLKQTKDADERTFLLLQDLIRHKGDLGAALEELQAQMNRKDRPRQ